MLISVSKNFGALDYSITIWHKIEHKDSEYYKEGYLIVLLSYGTDTHNKTAKNDIMK